MGSAALMGSTARQRGRHNNIRFTQLALIALSFGAALILAPEQAVAAHRGHDPEPERLYRSDCAVCHGVQAEGTDRGPTLVGVGAASLDYQLSTGRMPLAPAGRTEAPGRPSAPLPNQQLGDPRQESHRQAPAYPASTISALVGYVTALGGGGGPGVPEIGPGDVASGGQYFRLQCAACHAWGGEGGALFKREAPPLRPATPRQVAEAIRVGPGQMPAFGDSALTDAQVDDVVAYVGYLDEPQDRGGVPLSHFGPVAEGAVAMAGVVLMGLLLRWIGERS